MEKKVQLIIHTGTALLLTIYIICKKWKKKEVKGGTEVQFAVEYKKSDQKKQISKERKESVLETPVLRPQKQSMQTNFSLDHYRNESKSKRVFKIVLTGGPFAGKTSALTYCQDRLRNLGFKVYVIPESISSILQAGSHINIKHYNTKQQVQFQAELLRMQINIEDRYNQIAQHDENDKTSILLCYRGALDGYAYTDEKCWQTMLEENNLNINQLRDNRYDAIFHMVTMAETYPEFYKKEARYRNHPDIAEAIKMDKNLQKIYEGHNYMMCIGNQEQNFDKKIQQLFNSILQVINEPNSWDFQKKYLLAEFDIENFLRKHKIDSQQSKTEFTFLKDTYNTKNRRLVRRSNGDSNSYSLNELRVRFDEKTSQCTRRINAREYMDLYEQKDENKNTIFEKFNIFDYQQQKYKISRVIINDKNIFMKAFIQCNEEIINETSFIKDYIIRDITQDQMYENSQISEMNWTLPKTDQDKIDQFSAKKEKQTPLIASQRNSEFVLDGFVL